MVSQLVGKRLVLGCVAHKDVPLALGTRLLHVQHLGATCSISGPDDPRDRPYWQGPGLADGSKPGDRLVGRADSVRRAVSDLATDSHLGLNPVTNAHLTHLM